jgi:hypothetical protein
MATLVRDLLWNVSVELADHKPQFAHFLAREMIRAYNEGQTVIASLLLSSCARIEAIKLKPGALQSIETLATTDVKPTPAAALSGLQFLEPDCNMGTDGLTPGASINVVAKRDLDSLDSLWQTRTGTAVRSVAFDPRFPKSFLVEPAVPTTPAVWVRAKYIALPAALDLPSTTDGSSGANVALPAEHIQDLHAYMVARLSMKQSKWADSSKVDRFTQMFTGSMNSKVEALTGANPNLKRLPMATEPLTAAQ